MRKIQHKRFISVLGLLLAGLYLLISGITLIYAFTCHDYLCGVTGGISLLPVVIFLKEAVSYLPLFHPLSHVEIVLLNIFWLVLSLGSNSVVLYLLGWGGEKLVRQILAQV